MPELPAPIIYHNKPGLDFVIQDAARTTVHIVPFSSITIKEEQNKGVDGTLTISYPDIKKYAEIFGERPDDIFATSDREWYLHKDGVKIFGGIFLRRKVNGGSNGMTTYTVSLGDFSTLLAKRRTAELFERSSEDSADIVEDLLDTTNAVNDTGISMGLHPTTKNRDLTSRFANVRDEIVSMSNLKKKDGYDWKVDHVKDLNLYYPTKGAARPEIVFDEVNTISFSSDRDLQGKLTNKVIVLGKGFGENMASVVREDTSSQSTWGLLEDTVSEKGVETLAELEDRGDKFLDENDLPQDVLSIRHRDGSPDITSYAVGDTVTVRNDELNINTTYRIYKQTIQISSNGQATVDLSFE